MMEESNFYHCFLLTAEDRKEVGLTSAPQDLLLRSSLHQYFAGRRVQVRRRQLESDLLYRKGGFPQSVCSQPSSEIWSVEMNKQKQKNAFIGTWMKTGPPAPCRFGWTIICYQRVAIRCGIFGMPREHWASLTMGRPQQKGIPRLWLTRSHKICERLTKSYTLMLAFSNCMATNAQTFLSFWPKLTFEFRQQGSSVCACVCLRLRLWRGQLLYTASSLHCVAKQFSVTVTSPDTQHVWAHVPHTDNTSFCAE